MKAHYIFKFFLSKNYGSENKAFFKKFLIVSLMLFSSSLFSQQTRAIYGIVLSKKDKKPLAGAKIEIVKSDAQKKNPSGTGQTFTNEKGLFNFTVPILVSQITISLLGYKRQPLSLKKTKQYYAVYLTKENYETIGAVVLNGYQKISKERATGSYLNLDLKTFKTQRTSNNLIDLLKGQVPEMLFTNYKNPESLVLRGKSSFSNDNFPLVILDGFELSALSIKSNTISEYDFYKMLEKINIDNIENVFILKDAAASSIWGAKASNGVIVITTKKGRNTLPLISYHSSFSFQPRSDFHYYRKKRGSISDVIEIERLGVESDLGVSKYSPYYDANANPTATQAFLDLKEGRITQTQCDNIINQLRGQDALSEYRRLFIRNTSTQNHTISLQQGSDNYSFFASFDYLREESGTKGSKSERYNTLLNLSSQPLKGVNFSGGISFSRVKNSQSNSTADFFNDWHVYDKILDDQGNYVDYPFYVPQTQKAYEQSDVPYPYDFTHNLKRDFDHSHAMNKSLNVDLHAKLKINLLKGLIGTLQYRFQGSGLQREFLIQEGSNNLNKWLNLSAIFVDDDGIPSTPPVFDPTKGYSGFAKPQGDELYINKLFSNLSGCNVLVNYKRYLTQNQAHYINILAGASFSEKNYVSNQNETFYGYDPKILISLDLIQHFRDKHGNVINNNYISKKFLKKKIGTYLILLI